MTAAVEQVLAHWEAAQTPLTPLDREALAWLAEGLRTREMAARAGLSASTVRSRLRRLYERLGVRTGPAAVAVAVRDGLVEVPR